MPNRPANGIQSTPRRDAPEPTRILTDFLLEVEKLARDTRKRLEATAPVPQQSCPPRKAKKPHALHKFYDAFFEPFRRAVESGEYRQVDYQWVNRDGKPFTQYEMAQMARERGIPRSTADKYARFLFKVAELKFRLGPDPPDDNASLEDKRRWWHQVCKNQPDKKTGQWLIENCPDDALEDIARFGGIIW